MPKNVTEAYLGPEQEQSLATMRQVGQSIEFMPSNGFGSEEMLAQIYRDTLLAISRDLTLMKGYAEVAARTLTTMEEVDQFRRVQAHQLVSNDLRAHIMVHLTAAGAGMYQAIGDQEESGKSLELGYEIIHRRTAYTTRALLIGAMAVTREEQTPEGEGAWQRALDAYRANPRVKPPISINEADGEAHAALMDRLIDFEKTQVLAAPRISRFRTVNAIRMARKGRVGIRNMYAAESQPAYVLEQLDTLIPPTLELEPDEVQLAARNAQKMSRYILGARHLDGRLRDDPNVQFLVFIQDTMRAYDEKGERVVFHRDIQKYLKQAERAGYTPHEE